MTVLRPDLTGTFGAVSSTHWLASAVGMAVLERGGNAADAAVTAGFVLQVVEPHCNGPAGDVAIVAHDRATGTTRVVCGQGPMPQAATQAAFTGQGLTQVPASGLLPACVPGAFGGWLRLLAEFGTTSLEDALAPALGYASDGFPLLPAAARTIALMAPLFAAEWPGSAASYLPDGAPPAAGSRMRSPGLVATYGRLLREAAAAGGDREHRIEAARRAFYEGFVAEAIDDFVSSTAVLDETGEHRRGLLTGADLAGWRADVEPSWSTGYGDVVAHKPGPWSQGPVFLQQLALLAGCDLRGAGLGSAEYVHTVAEAAKLAFADREAWYGDPRYFPVPLAELLAEDYTKQRLALMGADAARDPLPGVPGGVESWIPQPREQPRVAGEPDWRAALRSGIPTAGPVPPRTGAGNTCSVSVIDRHGNLVAAVPSGGWLKSSPVIPELGFALGTRGQTMWLVDGGTDHRVDHPNAVAPGRRPRTTLSPTVALRDGEPFLAMGTPGGDQQDQWTLAVLLAVTEFGLDLQAATELPAFHIDHFPQSFAPRTARPGVVAVEESFGPAVLDELRARGHDVDAVPAHTLGKVCAVGAGGGFVRAGAGSRGRQAYAICR